MKYSFLLLGSLILSCTIDKSDPKYNESQFIKTAKHFHEFYITAGDCKERNAMVDKDIIFYENEKLFTYQDILDYCSYIKPKDVFKIYTEQYLIQPAVGFDYVDQYYTNQEADTLRETTSRIWQLKSDAWVVTHMQVSRQAAQCN